MSELKSDQSIYEYFQEKYNLSKDELSEMSYWRTYQNRIKSFCIKNNLDTFQTIFGQEEGLRLLKHFRSDCKEDFVKFLTYITLDQHNDLQAYIIKNY